MCAFELFLVLPYSLSSTRSVSLWYARTSIRQHKFEEAIFYVDEGKSTTQMKQMNYTAYEFSRNDDDDDDGCAKRMRRTI